MKITALIAFSVGAMWLASGGSEPFPIGILAMALVGQALVTAARR